MTIRLLTIDDAEQYLTHLKNVLHTKGIYSVSNEEEIAIEWVSNSEMWRFRNETTKVWAEFKNGNIIKSICTEVFKRIPMVYFTNYKSEKTNLYNPFIDVLPLTEIIFDYYENLGYFNYMTIRSTNMFSLKRYKLIENLSPLNRYNCYYDEIIPPNQYSISPLYKELLWNRTYPIELGVVSMSLKQEYRRYGNKKNIMFKRTDEPRIILDTINQQE